MNRRPVVLTLIDEQDRMVVNYTLPGVDATDWQPTSPWDPLRLSLRHTIAGVAPLPPSPKLLRSAVYRVGLWLPDARASLADKAAYAIRLANDARDLEWWTVGGQAEGKAGQHGGVNLLGEAQWV